MSIYDEIDKRLYARRYHNAFDQSISNFVSSKIIERQIEDEFLNKIWKLNQNDDYYEVRKNIPSRYWKKELDAVFSIKKSKQKKTKNAMEDIDEKQKDEDKCPKTKSIIEWDPTLSCSIKSLAIKETSEIKPITRIFSGKILIFVKVSLETFVYDLTQTFFFPNKKEIYNK